MLLPASVVVVPIALDQSEYYRYRKDADRKGSGLMLRCFFQCVG